LLLHDRPIKTRTDDSVVRVLFGPFSPIERFRSEAQDILWVTRHSIRL
jgi:hydrogenase maturation factor HypF (carbamoyltransferase family)